MFFPASPGARAVVCLVVSGLCAAVFFGALSGKRPTGIGSFFFGFMSGAWFMLFLSTLQIAEALKLVGTPP